MLTQEQFPQIVNHPLHGTDGNKIGEVDQIFVDPNTGNAAWLLVSTGLFGTKKSFIPAHDASMTADHLSVPFTKDTIKHAPGVSADDQQLSQEEQSLLLDYYATSGEPMPRNNEPEQSAQAQPDETSEVSMTVNEEQLRIEKETVEAGTATLRKDVVTEEQTFSVPVRREVATLDREPVSEDDQRATDKELGADEQQITLTEERVVVSKETVPVETVRLGKETVTEDQQFTETVSREQVDADLPEDNAQREG